MSQQNQPLEMTRKKVGPSWDHNQNGYQQSYHPHARGQHWFNFRQMGWLTITRSGNAPKQHPHTHAEQIIIFPTKPDLKTETRFPIVDFGFFVAVDSDRIDQINPIEFY